MLETNIQIQSEELCELISELVIRYWKVNKTYFLLKEQLLELNQSHSKEIEEYVNKINRLEEEKNIIVRKYNQIENENIILKNEVNQLKKALSEKEEEIGLLKTELENANNHILALKEKSEKFSSKKNNKKSDN